MDEVLYEVRGPKSLPEMTWEELQEAMRTTDIVLVPVGSTEQHGAHLPLGSDAFQGTEIGKRVARQLAARGVSVVVGPTIPFGVAPYHMGFPGTINLRSDTLKDLIKQVCFGLHRHGFRKFVLILGHGGNFATMQVAAQEIVDETGAVAVALNWLKVMMDRYPEVLKSARPTAESHSGEGETSRMLVTTPRLVQMRRARPVHDPRAEKVESPESAVLGGGVAYGIGDLRKATAWGNIGDPRSAGADTGEKLYGIIVDWICGIIQRDLVTAEPANKDAQGK